MNGCYDSTGTCRGKTYSQTVTPFVGSQQMSVQLGADRRLAGVFGADSGCNFYRQTERMRLFERAGMHPGFVDVAGNNAISSFEQYQHPPQTWFRPTPCVPRPRGGNSLGCTQLRGHAEDDDLFYHGRHRGYTVGVAHCDSDCRYDSPRNIDGECLCRPGTGGQFCHLPAMAARRRNQLLHGLAS